MERTAKAIDDWPLGPVAAGLMGAATAFFCFAMPPAMAGGLVDAAGLPLMAPLALAPDAAVARAIFVAVPALAAAALTWLLFVLIDGRTAPLVQPVVDEGDPAEDWLTAPAPCTAEPVAAPSPAAPFVAPLAIDPVPPVAQAPVMDELVLDTIVADCPPPARLRSPLPMRRPRTESVTEMLCRIEGGLPGKIARLQAARAAAAAPDPAPLPSVDEALQDVLAGLRRIAAR